MKTSILVIATLLMINSAKLLAQQKVIAECTVVFDLSVDDSKADAEAVKATTKTLYIKGTQSRSDFVSTAYTQVIIKDSKSDTTVILKEQGATKYISYISSQKRDEFNKKYEGITFEPTSETKTILGYDCKKVVEKLKDGSTYNVYYAPSIIPSYKEYEYQFKDVPGFVLEYEDGKNKIKYTAVKITLTQVPASKFDVPKSGYRVL